jgi:hypothetical protein
LIIACFDSIPAFYSKTIAPLFLSNFAQISGYNKILSPKITTIFSPFVNSSAKLMAWVCRPSGFLDRIIELDSKFISL